MKMPLRKRKMSDNTQDALRKAMDEAFDRFAKTLNQSARQNIIDSAAREQSITKDAFVFAWNAALSATQAAQPDSADKRDAERLRETNHATFEFMSKLINLDESEDSSGLIHRHSVVTLIYEWRNKWTAAMQKEGKQ
jgi:hypothetical protein